MCVKCDAATREGVLYVERICGRFRADLQQRHDIQPEAQPRAQERSVNAARWQKTAPSCRAGGEKGGSLRC
jgi:hypothetical protein